MSISISRNREQRDGWFLAACWRHFRATSKYYYGLLMHMHIVVNGERYEVKCLLLPRKFNFNLQVQDVTETLRAHIQESSNFEHTKLALSSQIHGEPVCVYTWVASNKSLPALSWSSQSPMSRRKNASLLALGNAGGSVYFLGIANERLRVRSSFQPSNNWITELRWTRWNGSGNSGLSP